MPAPMMIVAEVQEFVDKNNRLPSAEEMIKAPTTWIPIKPSNPSKLTLHWFDNGVWHETSYTKFISWPEMWPIDKESETK